MDRANVQVIAGQIVGTARDVGSGEAIAVIEVAVVLAIGTALFGSPALSERAFRLLRWLGNRPEPPGPASGPPAHSPQ